MTPAQGRFQAYGEAVCAFLSHATRREKAAVRQELMDHLTDHAEALLDAGCPPETAETRALAAMGEAREVGQALNQAFPRRWLVLSRLALAALVALLALVGLSLLSKLPYLSPSSAIAAAEQDLACGPTEVLAQRQEGDATFLLSWNDQVLLANMVSPAFWRGNLLPGQPLYCADRTRDAQQGIAAAGFRFYNQDTRQGWGQWAGLVSGWPEAVSVRLTGPEAPEPMEAALQPTGEGDQYFWVHHPYTGEALCPSYTQITLISEAGRPLTTAPITNPESFTAISPSQGVALF